MVVTPSEVYNTTKTCKLVVMTATMGREKTMKLKTAAKPHPVDLHVGRRVRLRRTLLCISQDALGERVGLTAQQIQKYERGENRIGASRLFDLSRALEVPPSFFFDDLPDIPETAPGIGSATPALDITAINNRETLDLVDAYYRIDDPDLRRRFVELAKGIAAVVEVDSTVGALHHVRRAMVAPGMG